MYNIDVCAICRETLSEGEVKVLSCNHPFHNECVKGWLSRVPSCPFCRAPVPHVVITQERNPFFITESDEDDSLSFNTQLDDDDVLSIRDLSETTDSYGSETDIDDPEDIASITGDHPDVIRAIMNYNFSSSLWLNFSENYDLTHISLESYMRNTREYSQEVVNNFVMCQVLRESFIIEHLNKLDCELLLLFQNDVMTERTITLVEYRLERSSM